MHSFGGFILFQYDRFEELRSANGITKKFIADAINRKAVVCQDWKYGKSCPNDEQLVIIAKILKTTPEYLRGETDNPQQKEKPASVNGDGSVEFTPDQFSKILDDMSVAELLALNATIGDELKKRLQER